MIGLKKRDMKKILKAGARQNSKNILETELLRQKNIFTQLQKR